MLPKAIWNLKEENLAEHFEKGTGLVSAPFKLAGIENLRLKVCPRDSTVDGRAGLFLEAPCGSSGHSAAVQGCAQLAVRSAGCSL